MVLCEFRFSPEALVGVRDARADRSGDLGLVRRDHAGVFVCVDGAVNLVREQLDRRGGDVGPLADAEVRGKRQRRRCGFAFATPSPMMTAARSGGTTSRSATIFRRRRTGSSIFISCTSGSASSRMESSHAALQMAVSSAAFSRRRARSGSVFRSARRADA